MEYSETHVPERGGCRLRLDGLDDWTPCSAAAAQSAQPARDVQRGNTLLTDTGYAYGFSDTAYWCTYSYTHDCV